MEDVTRSRLSEKAFYGTSETNCSRDGRNVSSSSQKITFTASRRMSQNCLKWANSCSRWALCFRWSWSNVFRAMKLQVPTSFILVPKLSMLRSKINDMGPLTWCFRWSWPTSRQCLCWTRGATSPSSSARGARAGCTWGCRRGSGTGSITSSPQSTRARRGGSSGWKVPHTPATLITGSRDFTVRIIQHCNPSHSHIYHLRVHILYFLNFISFG